MTIASASRRAVIAAALLAGLVGCGSQTTTLAEDAQKTLHQDVQRFRDASDDPAKAQIALERFRTDVNDLVASADLDPADALALITHAGLVEGALPDPKPVAAPAPEPKTVAESTPVIAKKTTPTEDKKALEAWQKKAEKAWKDAVKAKKDGHKGHRP